MTDLSEFYINHTSPDIRECFYYTLIGDQESFDKDKNPICTNETDKVLAKKVVINGKPKYYIKTGPHGKVYNPIGLFSEGQSNKYLAKAGKKIWDFKEVNSKVFDMYVSFLRTKNIAWINNAERELR